MTIFFAVVSFLQTREGMGDRLPFALGLWRFTLHFVRSLMEDYSSPPSLCCRSRGKEQPRFFFWPLFGTRRRFPSPLADHDNNSKPSPQTPPRNGLSKICAIGHMCLFSFSCRQPISISSRRISAALPEGSHLFFSPFSASRYR